MLEKLLDLYKSLSKKEREEFWGFISNIPTKIKGLEFLQDLNTRYYEELNNVDVKTREMIQSGVDEFFDSNLSKKDFIKHKESMIWGVLFQPPAIYGNTQAERLFIQAIFENWNPNKYVVMYCDGLRKKLGVRQK